MSVNRDEVIMVKLDYSQNGISSCLVFSKYPNIKISLVSFESQGLIFENILYFSLVNREISYLSSINCKSIRYMF